MCVPECFIRQDGKGFIVRKGGIDWDVWAVSFDDSHDFIATNGKVIDGGDVIEGGEIGRGDTIMQAVDNALAKIRAESPQGDK